MKKEVEQSGLWMLELSERCGGSQGEKCSSVFSAQDEVERT